MSATIETYDDGTVIGAGLLSKLVGEDEVRLTFDQMHDSVWLDRRQVAALKAVIAAYEAHNGTAE